MPYSAHDTYLESRVLAADPLELVRLLHQGAINAVRDARHYLSEGKIAERSQAITKAFEILTELSLALDHERGGELSTRLAALYDYLQRKLLEANFHQTDPPLREVRGLLSTLSEAWTSIKPPETPATPESPWSQPVPEAAASHAPGSWSL